MSDDPNAEDIEPGAPGPTTRVDDRADIPWGLASFLVGAILFTTFVLQNGQDVELRFLGWDGTFPLSFIIVIVTVVTVILDEILGLALRRRRKKRRAEREELKRLRGGE